MPRKDLFAIICSIDGCRKPMRARNMCIGHWSQWRRGVLDGRPLPDRSRPKEERFWEKVDKTGECWLWTGSKGHFGYGQLRTGQKLIESAHRLAWEFTNGGIPEGLNILHKCDVPACVRPSHLFIGTQQENVTDMIGKGRANYGGRIRGEMVNTSVITEDDVRRIRGERASGMSLLEIATGLGVQKMVVWRVVSGKTWKHVE